MKRDRIPIGLIGRQINIRKIYKIELTPSENASEKGSLKSVIGETNRKKS